MLLHLGRAPIVPLHSTVRTVHPVFCVLSAVRVVLFSGQEEMYYVVLSLRILYAFL